jgi:hypothetical protein
MAEMLANGRAVKKLQREAVGVFIQFVQQVNHLLEDNICSLFAIHKLFLKVWLSKRA